MPKFIDVHTHTHFAAYENPKEIVERALKNDIWVVNVGTQQTTSKDAVLLARQYSEGVYAAVGLHPIHTSESFHDEKELGGGDAAKAFVSRGERFDYDYYLELARDPKVVAIGECGLDYYRLSDETKARQFKTFEVQIFLSFETKKPLMIHCRNGLSGGANAFSDLVKIIKYNDEKISDNPGVVHFFAGSKADARALMDLGFYFSFGGVTTFVRDYDEVIKYIGIDRILLETDAPYVTPVPYRGKRNEPLYLPHVAESIGKILNLDAETVAKRTTENARRVLKI